MTYTARTAFKKTGPPRAHLEAILNGDLRLPLLTVAAFLVICVGAASALANTIEAPFWHVGGKRLEGHETRGTAIKNPTGAEVTLHATIGGGAVEIRCKKDVFAKSLLEGSFVKTDGVVRVGAIELAECKLFNMGKEKTECGVPSITSNPLAGRMWLEGTELERGNRILVVFEPESGGVPVAEVTITGASCTFKGTFSLEGKFAANIEPEKEEVPISKYILPVKPIEKVWQPQGNTGNESLALSLDGNTASLQGEQEIEPASKEEFSEFAPHSTHEFIVKEGTLPSAVEGSGSTSKLGAEILKTKLVITCKKDKITGEIEKEAKSKATLLLSECEIEGMKACTVPNLEIKTSNHITGTLVSENEFKPAGGEVFVEIGIESCALSGKYKVTGTQTCKLPGGEISTTSHEIKCTSTGGKLKLGSQEATFESTAAVKLGSGKAWSAV